jgi:hypothetical protein
MGDVSHPNESILKLAKKYSLNPKNSYIEEKT